MNMLRRPITSLVKLLCLLLSPLPSQAQPADWHLVPELRFGATDGPHALTTVTAILTLSNPDKAYVAQPKEQHVKVIDLRTREIVATIGRRGTGPGEFQLITRMSWAHDTLVVADQNQARLVMFSKDGIHIRTQRVISNPLAPLGRPANAVAPATPGNFWGEVRPNMMLIANGIMSDLPVVLMSSSGEVESEVVSLKVKGMMAAVDYGNGVGMFVQPLAARTIYDFSADGSLVATVDASEGNVGGGREPIFTVRLFSHLGIEEYRKSFRYRAKPVRREARDSILRAYSGFFSSGNSKGKSLELAERHVTIPAEEPPVSDVLVTGEGWVWLRREEIGARSQWVVLDRAGRHVANVTAPKATRLLTVRGSHAFGTEEDELGIPYVVRYRVHVN